MPSNRKLRTVFAALAALAVVPAHADIPPAERAALLSVYAATNGANWSHNDGWNTAVGFSAFCCWYCMSCWC